MRIAPPEPALGRGAPSLHSRLGLAPARHFLMRREPDITKTFHMLHQPIQQRDAAAVADHMRVHGQQEQPAFCIDVWRDDRRVVPLLRRRLQTGTVSPKFAGIFFPFAGWSLPLR